MRDHESGRFGPVPGVKTTSATEDRFEQVGDESITVRVDNAHHFNESSRSKLALRKVRRSMGMSTIEWTEKTWNPATGCTKVSSGCKFCYAEKLATRLKAMGSARYENVFAYTEHWDKLDEPRSWKTPRTIFVNSMSDLFHEEADPEFVRRVFQTMMETPRHRYQVLTKRPERMAELLTSFVNSGDYEPSQHIWLGTSVESDLVLDRIEHLKNTPAGVRFLSCEPLISDLGELEFEGLHWVIVGGESGVHLFKERTRSRRALVSYENGCWEPREERAKWVRSIRDQCVDQCVAFFFKQWGGATPKAGGRHLDGATWDQYPRFEMMEAISTQEMNSPLIQVASPVA